MESKDALIFFLFLLTSIPLFYSMQYKVNSGRVWSGNEKTNNRRVYRIYMVTNMITSKWSIKTTRHLCV
uniref:Uncharacterized protein n=1 Tax=Escherichia phage PMBT16 TaxID=3137282 RepID=A0AAU8BVX0_9VIRU